MTNEVQQTAALTIWEDDGDTFIGSSDTLPITIAQVWEPKYAPILAAAPALLEALEACEQEIRQYHADEDCRGGCPAEAALSVARAAIRAARGEA